MAMVNITVTFSPNGTASITLPDGSKSTVNMAELDKFTSALAAKMGKVTERHQLHAHSHLHEKGDHTHLHEGQQ